LGLLSALYGAGLSCKKYFHRNPDKLPAKVISIGNLTLDSQEAIEGKQKISAL
jgi:tetraacyldisaccharide-1-P 4'-kinase